LKETGRTDLDQAEMQRTRRFVEDTIGLEEHYALERQTVETSAPRTPLDEINGPVTPAATSSIQDVEAED
jgi:hypothetical protein